MCFTLRTDPHCEQASFYLTNEYQIVKLNKKENSVTENGLWNCLRVMESEYQASQKGITTRSTFVDSAQFDNVL